MSLFPMLAGRRVILHASFCVDAFPPRRRGFVMLEATAGEFTRPELIVMDACEDGYVRNWLMNNGPMDAAAADAVIAAAGKMERHYMHTARETR